MVEEDPVDRIVPCSYCGSNAELVDSARVYGRSYGLIWFCGPCHAWVGVHAGSKSHKPKGSLAKSQLRKLRQDAHAVFDPIWRVRSRVHAVPTKKARKSAYQELSLHMGIRFDDCHIAMFDETQCLAVIDFCLKWKEATTEVAASSDSSGPSKATTQE